MVKHALPSYSSLKFIYNQCKLRKTHGTFSTQNFKHKWDDFVTVLHDNHKKKKNNLPSWFFLRGFLYCDFVLTNEEIGKTDFQIKNQLHIVKDIKKFLKACVFNLPVSLDCVLPPHRVGYLLKLFNKITNRLINHVQDHPILLKISSCSSLQKNFSSLLKELCDLLNLLCTIWVTHVSKILTWWSLRCAMNCVNDDIYSLDVLYLLGLCRYISQLNSPMVTSDVRKSFIFLYETILAMQLATLKNLVQSPIYNQTPYNNEKSNAIKTNFLFEESFQNFLKQLENNTEFPFQTSFVLRKPAQRIRKFTFYDLVGSLHQRVRLSEPNLFLYNNENKTVIFQQIGFLHCLPYFFSCFYFQSQELRSLKKSNSDTLYAVLIFLVNLQYPLLETTQQDMFPLMESLVTLNRLLQLLTLYHLEAPSDILQNNFNAMLNALLLQLFSILKNPSSSQCVRNEAWKCLQEIFSLSIHCLDDHLLCCFQCSSDEEIVLQETSIITKRNETLAFIMKKLAKACDLSTFFKTLEIFISQTTTSQSVEPFSIKSLLSPEITECIKIICETATLTQLPMFWNQLLSLVNKAWISKDASDSLSVFKTEAYFICCTFLSNFLQHVSLPENFIIAIIPILEAVNNLLSKTKPFTTIGDSNKKDFQEIFNSLKKLSNQAYISLLHAHLHLCTQLDNWMNPCDSQKPTNFSSTFLQPSITSDSYRETLIESTQKHMKIVTNYLKAASQKKNLPDILLETSIGEILLKSCHLLLELCIAYPIRYYKDRTTSVKVIKVLRILFLFNSKIKKKKFIQYQHFCSLLPLCCALMEQFQKTSCSVSVFVKLFKKITHKIFKYFIIDATNFFYAKHENIFDFSIQFLPMFFQKMDTLIYNFILDLPLMYQYIVLCGLKKIAEKKLIKAMRLLTHNFKKQSTFQIEKFLILLKVFSCFFNRYPGIFFIKSRNASAIMKFLKKLCHAIPSLNVVCLDRNYHQLNNEMKKNMYMIHLVDSLINFVIYQSGSSFCLKPSCLKYVLIVCSSLQSCIKQMANQIIEHYHMPTIIQLLQLNSKLLHFFIHHLYQCDMGKHKKRMMRCIEGINILCFPILNLQLTDSLTSASNSLFENHLQLCITFPCNNFVSCFNFLQTLPAFYFVRKTLIAFPHLQIQACTLNASFIENVYSFLSPLTINEDISFIEQLTYLTSSYFLSILIILCQRRQCLKNENLIDDTSQVLAILVQHSTLFPQDRFLLKFKNILNTIETDATLLTDIINFSSFISSHVNNHELLDKWSYFSTIVEILYNKAFYYIENQFHCLQENLQNTLNVLHFFSNIFNPTQTDLAIPKIHMNHFWQLFMKQIIKRHQMISLIKILFEKSSFDLYSNHMTFFQLNSYVKLTTLLTCFVFISQQRIVLFNFLGIRKQTKKNTESLIKNKIHDSKLLQLLRQFIHSMIFILRSHIQFFQFQNLISKQSQDFLMIESFIKKCFIWVIQYKLFAQITINIHEACKLGILQQKNNDYWKMSLFDELLSLTIVGLYQHSEISRCLNCLCDQNHVDITDLKHIWISNKKKKSTMIAQIFFFQDILTTIISSCCYATVSLRKDICSRNSLPCEFFYRHLIKRTHQLKYIVQEMCRMLDSSPTPETALPIVRQLIRIWNWVYLTPCSLSKILKREIVHVLQSVLSLNILISTSLSTTRSFNFKSNLFNLLVSVEIQNLEHTVSSYLDYSDEENKWQNIKSILLYDGLYPLLESMDDMTKKHFFAGASTYVRDTFTMIHKDFEKYRTTHAFQKDKE